MEQIDRTSKSYKKEIMSGTVEDWFAETVKHADAIYTYVENLGQSTPNLSYQFVYDFFPVLEEQLLHGGYRLAYVLNCIFDGK